MLLMLNAGVIIQSWIGKKHMETEQNDQELAQSSDPCKRLNIFNLPVF